jgi:hypothetical protein
VAATVGMDQIGAEQRLLGGRLAEEVDVDAAV